MSKHAKHDAFGKVHASSYDQRNQYLAPINENLYYLIPIVLNDLPAASRILFVGSGTGTEIITLAQAFPQARFNAVEPSDAMLDVCRTRLQEADLLKRCELVHGYVHDLPLQEAYDAAICLLVLHHVGEHERDDTVKGIRDRLNPSGSFVLSELSYDFSEAHSNDLMEKWKVLNRKTGSPEEKIQNLPALMKEHLSIQPPSEVEGMLAKAGFLRPVQFFQSLLIRAWYAQRD